MTPFSEKQMQVLCWWGEKSPHRDKLAVICDGAVRSGKTTCMGISFFLWAMARFQNTSFAVCGKTIRSVRRNVVAELIPKLKSMGFSMRVRQAENEIILSYQGRENRFYLFGGRDESSAALIQGMTLSGVLFDEVALMPRSLVEQALARCSVSGSRFWFNCNPEFPEHWFYREWIKKCGDKNALYLHFTMQDNPSLKPEVIKRYESLYSGVFYERFVKGRWVAVFGAVYPFMDNERMYCDIPSDIESWAVSCDYGTVNPASFGLWGRKNGVWYRVDEYYFNSRTQGFQKTDEEHYDGLEKLIDGRKIECVIVDPSAASFIEVIRRHGKYMVVSAENNVINGIRQTSQALKDRKIRICKNCRAARREFSLYRWDGSGRSDAPVKENDHAMDDIRYFVATKIYGCDGFFAVAAKRQEETA